MSPIPPQQHNPATAEDTPASTHSRSADYDVCRFIIDKPEKQPPGQKLLLGGITLLFWGAWSFLWAPLANTLGWAFGFYAFYEHFVLLHGWDGVVNQLPVYALVVQIMGGGLIFWALINWGRFRGHERRQALRDITQDDVAGWQTQPPDHIAAWQKTQRLVVHFDANGKLTGVETK